MELKFFKSKWEAGHLGLEEFLEEVREAGFDGTENVNVEFLTHLRQALEG